MQHPKSNAFFQVWNEDFTDINFLELWLIIHKAHHHSYPSVHGTLAVSLLNNYMEGSGSATIK